MTTIISHISQFLITFFTLIENFLSGVGQFAVMIPQALGMLTYTIGSMPTVLIGFLTALVMVNIVYLVVGR